MEKNGEKKLTSEDIKRYDDDEKTQPGTSI